MSIIIVHSYFYYSHWLNYNCLFNQWGVYLFILSALLNDAALLRFWGDDLPEIWSWIIRVYPTTSDFLDATVYIIWFNLRSKSMIDQYIYILDGVT